MLEEIKKMVEENLGVDASNITEATSFSEDLNADSIDLYNLVMAVEDKYNIEVPAEELEKLLTVGDVMNYVNSHK